MKAIVLSAYGDVRQFVARYVPEPTPGTGEVKVCVAAASIDPVDWKLRSGACHSLSPLAFPAILGRDVSGTVVALGPGVTSLEVGQRVLGLVNAAYAEFVVAPADAWAPVPARLDLVDAAALPLALLTGAQLIEEAVNPSAGDVVLVIGAVGSVGRAAVFAANARGAKVWAAVRASQKDAASKLGAAGVVAIDDDADVARMPPLDAIADAAAGEVVQRLWGTLKRGGIIGTVAVEPAGAQERGFVVRGLTTHVDAKRLAVFAQAVADGKLVIPIAKRFPLSRMQDAQQLAEHHPGGKVLVMGRPVRRLELGRHMTNGRAASTAGPAEVPNKGANWLPVSPDLPCPVCKGTFSCHVGFGGRFVCCKRMQSDSPVEWGGWLHEITEPVAPVPLMAQSDPGPSHVGSPGVPWA